MSRTTVDAKAAFAEIEAHFHALLELPSAARGAALANLSVSASVRQELLRLLAADTSADCLAQLYDAVAEAGQSPLDGPRRNTETAEPGMVFGPWRLLAEIGAGGMGTVFAAERADGQYATEVAIKLLRGFPTSEAIDRLRQERQILAALDHPNIARLLDGGETPAGQPYVVMERVRGQQLEDWLRAAPRSLKDRLSLFQKLCAAVMHAHQQLIVHRDIKPSNVLVRVDNEPKLLDFGVSKLLDWQDERQTSTRVFSRGYTSPEQLQGQRISTRSDVYSLGVLLEAMLSGQPPYDAHARWPGVPIDAELKLIISTARAEHADDRYASVADLAADVDRYQRGLPLLARAPGRLYLLSKFAQRHRVAVSISVMATVLTLFGIWRLITETDRARQAETEALAQSARSEQRFMLLSEVFAGIGNPDAAGQVLDANGLLDRARDRLLERFADDPAEGSPFEQLLGDAYLRAERWHDAERMYAASVRHAKDRSALEVQKAIREWARMLMQQNQPALAIAVLDLAPVSFEGTGQPIDRRELQVRLSLTRLDAMAALQTPGVQALEATVVAYAEQHLPAGHQLRAVLRFRQAQRLELAGDYQALVPVRAAILQEWSADPTARREDLAFQELNLARAIRLAGASADAAWAALQRASDHDQASYGAQLSQLKHEISLERAALAFRDGEIPRANQYVDEASNVAARIPVDTDLESTLLQAEIRLAAGDLALARSLLAGAAELSGSPIMRARLQQLQQALRDASAGKH
ncbi:hypothetical protein C7S18_17150 [Ahniella affigens]|uniref:Protein kinase domain-containing protein n=1 Tax=Ahniella affigens TaxID=2021234 RepID=A0A2P1PVE9_9GAMM|nr:serine/threonine-protein kinase [Ahniella affigens]AVP98802.1 hypothetical protein C7S18_17150 [Ahniella affigens]